MSFVTLIPVHPSVKYLMNNYVKYEYLKEDTGVYAQTPLSKKVSIDFNADANLSTYFDEFIRFLLDVGFTNKEITIHLKSICNYEHEISTGVRSTEEKGLGS